MSSPNPPPFTTSLEIEGGVAFLRVHGPVEASSFRGLREAIGRTVERGTGAWTVDLAAVSSMDVDGFGALAVALRDAGRTSGQGGPDPTSRARVVLDAATIANLVVEQPAPTADENSTALGDEMHPGDRSAAVPVRASDVAAGIARLGSMPASHAVVDGALRLVTMLAAETVEGADGVSVSLQRHGRLATVAASNQTVTEMDCHQYDTGEGPCVSAAEAGHWFHVEALSEERRWPTFVPLAREQGIASILSTPLLAAERPVGALNMYSNRERVFGPREQELAALFSAQASGILEDAGVSISADELDRRVLAALVSREVIAQAQGVLMALGHRTPEEAADVLRDAAREAGTTVVAESERIIASTRLPTAGPKPSDG